jgi:hypothetical protein
MRLRGMADGFSQQQEDPTTTQLAFEERFALLVDRQWNWRQNRALQRRLREGRLQGPACMEDIDFRAARGLDKQVVRSLIHDSDWVRRHQHIFLRGYKTFCVNGVLREDRRTRETKDEVGICIG